MIRPRFGSQNAKLRLSPPVAQPEDLDSAPDAHAYACQDFNSSIMDLLELSQWPRLPPHQFRC
ncbi:hypothetical protein MPC4_360020 [Methylocella tundrae]|uniref:Uncharacterized protein n=1 Tax=Methylocella tundrae TaxID=227605 RepID=A0A8B6M950_METTU|nr:hypothetical protein MPC4_360020 [Methylocella tundrae]